MLNVQTLIDNLLPALHSDSLANLVFWTDGELTRWFKEALMRHAQKFGVFVRRDANTLLTQSQPEYTAPANFLDGLHLAMDATPLVASSTTELEALDDAYQVTEGTPERWYTDRVGANVLGVQPVPDAAAAGSMLDVIYHEYPCNLDEAHTNVDIDTPRAIGVLLELLVLGEAYSKESDAQMPETAQSARAAAAMIEEAVMSYYGEAQ